MTGSGRGSCGQTVPFVLAAALCFAGPGIAAGETWYVRPSGNDAFAGTSPDSALRTISRAAELALPGDTVYVGAGTYGETVEIERGGESDAMIAYIADTSGKHTGDAGNVIVTGAGTREYGFQISNRSYIRLSGFRVIGTTQAGLYVDRAEGVVIENCRLYDNQGDGAELDGQQTGAPVQVRRSRIYGNAGRGLLVDGQGVVVNCWIYANGADGIAVDNSDGPLTLMNNTVVGNGGGLHIEGQNASTTVRNNLIAWNAGTGILRDGSDLDSDYNLLWHNQGGNYEGLSAGDHDVKADPKFVDRESADYRLLAGSPAINAGTIVNAPSQDIDGHSRNASDGAIDIGGYERVLRIIRWREVTR